MPTLSGSCPGVKHIAGNKARNRRTTKYWINEARDRDSKGNFKMIRLLIGGL